LFKKQQVMKMIFLTEDEFRTIFRDEYKNLTPVVGNKQQNEQPVTTKQLCEFLGVTEPTIIRWRNKGKIPFMRIGSSIRFNLSAVVSALEVKKKFKGNQ
jgi:excisionase family DNA binding protein